MKFLLHNLKVLQNILPNSTIDFLGFKDKMTMEGYQGLTHDSKRYLL